MLTVVPAAGPTAPAAQASPATAAAAAPWGWSFDQLQAQHEWQCEEDLGAQSDEEQIAENVNSRSLSAYLCSTLMTEHSFLPLLTGGVLAARAALRLMASLLAALALGAAVFVADAHLSSDNAVDCANEAKAALQLLVAGCAAWILLTLENIAQYFLRWRRLAGSRVTRFSHGEVLEAMEDIDFNDAIGFWPSIEEGSEFDLEGGEGGMPEAATSPPTRPSDSSVQDSLYGLHIEPAGQCRGPPPSCALPPPPGGPRGADAIAERFVQEYGRLAPAALSTSTSSSVSPLARGSSSTSATAPALVPLVLPCAPSEVATAASAQVTGVQPPRSAPKWMPLRHPGCPQGAALGHRRPPAPSFPPPLASGSPRAKVPGDAQHGEEAASQPSSQGGTSAGVAFGRPPSSMSHGSHHSGRTGVSSGAASSTAFTYSTVTCTTKSSRSVISVLSLTRNAPNVQVRQPLDLEALKLRYIQSIAAKQDQVEGDQRLDCWDVTLTIDALDGRRPSLGITGVALAVAAAAACLGAGLGLGIGLGAETAPRVLDDCWPLALGQVIGGWLLAVFILDAGAVLMVAVARWKLLQARLAARRDHRWIRVRERREQKAEAMGLDAESAATPAGQAGND
mmetsp:Transcript_33977/g.62023  ORF Transcript_33977/g.62023 Transcript_33977/m.62023 type:complete len:622 (+) Transcript_33977:60-1925(+)